MRRNLMAYSDVQIPGGIEEDGMKWVLVDLSFLAHRARHATSNLEFEDIPTGVMYGFFEQLYSICKSPAVSSNRVLIFTDSRRSYRSRQFPDYKRKRREQRSEEERKQISIMYDQVSKLRRNILPAIGFPVFRQVGLESDDLIAWVAKELTRRKEHGVMITSDGDLYQCISQYVKWYDPARDVVMNTSSFISKKRVIPKKWGRVKAIAGCSSDNVPGLKGIGEASAIKYLLGEMPEHTKKYQVIASSREEIREWGRLTILPHKKTKPIDFHSPEYDTKAFFRFCEQYHILSYFKPRRREQWVKFFEGTFRGKVKRRRG